MTRNLVFTSCGDNTSFDLLWTHPFKMNFDIYIIYYGECKETFRRYYENECINIITIRQGSKFQNLKFFYDTFIDIINKYKYFFILDDDIIIDVEDINKMFSIAKKYNLSICGPSFKPESKISHDITIQKSYVEISYTNFVELNVPLFSFDALVTFMNFYDGSLIGWGIDYLYINVCGLNNTNSYAIVHIVSCINPHAKFKKHKRRELSLIDGFENRRYIWVKYAESKGYKTSYKKIEYKSIMIDDYENKVVSIDNK